MTSVYTKNNLAEVATLLLNGQTVAIPTETVYGLAAPIFNEKSVQQIFSLKGRPPDNPLIAHVSSLEMAESIAQDIPESFYLLAEKFWPGPLTLVLPRKPCVPDVVTAGQRSIAIRMPSHPLALQLIKLVGVPLVAPSANLSGKPSPTCVSHVLEDFGMELTAILDGGPCQIGIESTIVNLTSKTPTLLRPGFITKEQIEAVLSINISLHQQDNPILAPGMKYRHYAPKGFLYLVDKLPKLPKDAFILSREEISGYIYRALTAQQLYAHLREADFLQIKEIWVVLDAVSLADPALMNRLRKAASKV